MKKPSSRIRQEISKLQDALKVAETREAERLGRIALKAGLGEIETEEAELLEAFEHVARRFRAESFRSDGGDIGGATAASREQPTLVVPGAAPGCSGEA